MAEAPAGRRTFLPVVGLGVASAALMTVASTKVWATPTAEGSSDVEAIVVGYSLQEQGGQVPLVSALGFVVLACWGVVLVTRSRLRRLMAALGAFAGVSAFAVTVSAYWLLPDVLQVQYAAVEVNADYTGWFVTALVAASVAAAAAAVGAFWVGRWPEMGSRYDAPSAPTPGAPADDPPEEQSNLDLWKAIDEGRDPTQGRS